MNPRTKLMAFGQGSLRGALYTFVQENMHGCKIVLIHERSHIIYMTSDTRTQSCTSGWIFVFPKLVKPAHISPLPSPFDSLLQLQKFFLPLAIHTYTQESPHTNTSLPPNGACRIPDKRHSRESSRYAHTFQRDCSPTPDTPVTPCGT